MFKTNKYDVNVFDKYDGYFYMCKSPKERDNLIKWLKRYNIATTNAEYGLSDFWIYLVITKQYRRVSLYCIGKDLSNVRKYTKCNLKEFVNLFRIIKKKYTIYGRKLC